MFLFILILKSEFWVKSQKGEKKKISLNYYLLIDISSSHKLCFLLSTPRGKQSCHDHSCEDLLKLNTISSSAGEGLRFQSRYLEFWDHGHWARHRGRTLSQIPANEGERSAERSNPSGNVWLMTQNKYKVSSSDPCCGYNLWPDVLLCVCRSWCWRCRTTRLPWRRASQTRRWLRNMANPSGRWSPCVYRRTRRKGVWNDRVNEWIGFTSFFSLFFLFLGV